MWALRFLSVTLFITSCMWFNGLVVLASYVKYLSYVQLEPIA